MLTYDRPVPGAGNLLDSVVHPGWLAKDGGQWVEEDDAASTEIVRFTAFAQLMRTAGALDRAATEVLSSLGVTAGAFFALLELEAVGDAGIAPSELARRLAVARRTATLYVDILVKHGWVSREAHPDDKRMILARLTETGHEIVRDTAVRYKAQLARLMSTLSLGQAARLNELLGQVPLEADTLTCEFLQTDDEELY
ncbi:MAG: MarR family transcriptional regulator [Chloroflexota bacterium]|jgi:DNA-binding MarR family transcriptional regulator|nr:MarR family transcriptional regulator [Chloroflexota bacterium]